MVVDKPAGWLVAPETWTQTARNFQLALMDALARREHWARVRSLRFLRYVHRLDADTSGLLMVAKSPAAVEAYSMLFRERQVEKGYLAVVSGCPKSDTWTCSGPLLTDRRGKHVTVSVHSKGKPSETRFQVLYRDPVKEISLVWCMPVTGRTHQIRVHLKHGGFPILGDVLYHPKAVKGPPGLGLRAMWLAYTDPYTERRQEILASAKDFLQAHLPEAQAAWEVFRETRKGKSRD